MNTKVRVRSISLDRFLASNQNTSLETFVLRRRVN